MHRLKRIALLGFACTGCATLAPAPVSTEDRALRLGSHVSVLSADAMEGRGAGTRGEMAAAAYIAGQFKAIGLEPARGGHEIAFDFIPVGGMRPFETLHSRNVVGILRGSDRGLGAIVLGAHFDGQGMIGDAQFGRLGVAKAGPDRIWNSASDNATSIAALIEIARALKQARTKPRRSIVFVAFSGEENRLNGSVEFVRTWPIAGVRPAAMINMEKLVGHEPTEFITASGGSSPTFGPVTALAAERSGVAIKPFYDGVVTDTDHFPFLIAGIPGITIGTGAYERVHRHDDEFATLQTADFDARVGFILAFVEALADERAELKFTADIAGYSGILGGAATPLELQRCGVTGPAFLVTEVARAATARSRDLHAGDMIVSVNGRSPAFTDNGANMIEDVIPATGMVKLSIECRGQVRETSIEIAHPAQP